MAKVTRKVLKQNEWLSLMELDGPTGPYIYAHEERCNGKIVVILPYRETGLDTEYLLRDEYTPPWDTDKNCISSITGGVDKGEEPLTAAVRELKEETGYDVGPGQLTSLGTTRGAKSSDTTYHLYAIDVTTVPGNGNEGDPNGDANEALAKNVWKKAPFGSVIADPMVYASYCKLREKKDKSESGEDFYRSIKW